MQIAFAKAFKECLHTLFFSQITALSSQLGVVVHACDPSTGEAEWEAQEFEATNSGQQSRLEARHSKILFLENKTKQTNKQNIPLQRVDAFIGFSPSPLDGAGISPVFSYCL